MKKTYTLTLMAVFVAIGTLAAQFLWFPAGFAKAYPVQHAVNVMAAITLGPGPAVIIAFMIGLLRNMLGLGTLLAFPGAMVGAWFAGLLYRRFEKKRWAIIGESIGTGIVGSLLAVPIARLFMDSSAGALFFVPSFLASSISGAFLGWFIVSRVNTDKLIRIQRQ